MLLLRKMLPRRRRINILRLPTLEQAQLRLSEDNVMVIKGEEVMSDNRMECSDHPGSSENGNKKYKE